MLAPDEVNLKCFDLIQGAGNSHALSILVSIYGILIDANPCPTIHFAYWMPFLAFQEHA